MELLGTDIELWNAEGTFRVVYDKGIFTATSNQNGYKLKFKLTKMPYELSGDERHKVLKYNLGGVDARDVVTIKDIFMHNEFVKEII